MTSQPDFFSFHHRRLSWVILLTWALVQLAGCSNSVTAVKTSDTGGNTNRIQGLDLGPRQGGDDANAVADVDATPLDNTPFACQTCVSDADCAVGQCVEIGCGWYCALPCSATGGNSCSTTTSCQTRRHWDGNDTTVCAPAEDACAGLSTRRGNSPDSIDGSDAATATVVAAGGSSDQPLLVPSLDFVVVGDTRPPVPDATSSYPTPVIRKIWKAAEAEKPPVFFAVTTGDYVFAKPTSKEGAAQMDLYLGAQSYFCRKSWHCMGNHECTGATDSNCGASGKDGQPTLYKNFLSKFVQPMGFEQPYFTVWYADNAHTWKAKFVFIAANAWDSTQAAWLKGEMAKPSTYTFVVRHESSEATDGPGVTPSEDIIAGFPYTLLVVGHRHTYKRLGIREVIVGNGGAPLVEQINYGYVVIRRRPDAAIQLTSYDYLSHAVFETFALAADGTEAATP